MLIKISHYDCAFDLFTYTHRLFRTMDNLFFVLLIIFISTLVQSVFSFGGALVALPLLALVIDIRWATPLLTLLSCSIAIVVSSRNWHDVQVDSVWRLIVAACVGIPLGIWGLTRFNEQVLKVGLALVVIVSTLINLYVFKNFRLKRVNSALVFGFVSGVFGGAYNTSGPPVVLYGTLRNWNSEQFRATIQLYSLCTNIFAIAGYYIAGALTADVIVYYGWSLPIVAVTIWLGGKIHQKIPSEKYVIYVKLLLLVLAIRLLYVSLI